MLIPSKYMSRLIYCSDSESSTVSSSSIISHCIERVVMAGRALGSMMAQLEEYKQHAAVAAEQVCCLAS